MAIKKAGVRFERDEYYEITIGEDESISLKSIIDGTETDYDVTGGGGGWQETLLWENPEPTKGLKVETVLITSEQIAEDYDYYKIVYRNINNSEATIDFIFKLSDYVGNSPSYNFNAALVSSNEEGTIYLRSMFYDSVNNTWNCVGECLELSAELTNKNFRAIPELVYGYKQTEVE